MKVVICGAGQVGYGIAEHLAGEKNDVTIIDNTPELIHSVRESLDVRGIVGHGSHPDILADAGAEEADMLIAVTFSDEVNMIACQLAHSIFTVPTKVARVRNQSYLQPAWQHVFSRENMPIDVIISPEIEVGESVLRRLALPGVIDTVLFSDDQIEMIAILTHEDCPVLETPLRQLTDLFPDLHSNVVGISRNDTIFIPKPDDQLLANDIIYFIAERSQTKRTLNIFGIEEMQARRIVIAGGGNIGFYVAKKLEEQHSSMRIKVIENNKQRAIELADTLDKSIVLNGSSLSEEILNEADIRDASMMVALTNDDKVNILSSVLAQKMGGAKTLTLLNDRTYHHFAGSLGIDAFVNPRRVTISKILRHIRRGRIRGVHSVEHGAAEVIEAEALKTSPLVGKNLADLHLPDGIKIGAIYRNKKFIRPDKNTQIMAGDRVIIFALSKQVRKVEQMFRVSIEFF